MNKALPVITESPQDLQQRMRAEPAAPKRRRLQALYLLASGQATSRVALAALLAVHRHTIRAWLTQYEAGGLAALRRIVPAAPDHLVRGGWLCVEHGHDQPAPVRELFLAHGFEDIETTRDLAGVPRVTCGRTPHAHPSPRQPAP